MIPLWIILGYLVVLLLLGFASNRVSTGTQVDYFLASRGVGPVMLLMSLFGTTMTAFAVVGSSGEASQTGIGVYGLMASASGIVHALCFFLVGMKLWAFGKRHGYLTQIEFFRDRFESDAIGLLLFPLLVLMLFPYLLTGVLGLGGCITGVTTGAFPDVFKSTNGAIPPWLGEGIIVSVVLVYIFVGGVRSTLWVNAFQNVLFMGVGIVAMFVIAEKMGGFENATRLAREKNPSLLKRTMDEADKPRYEAAMVGYETKLSVWKETKVGPAPRKPHKPGIDPLDWLSYMLIPLSVAVFPHLFQYYLTAKSAKAFKLSVVGHPIFVMITWLPCVLLGVWFVTGEVNGKSILPPDADPNRVLAMGIKGITGPVLSGLMAAGILATNSLDAQFLVLGNMFTNDIVAHYAGRERFSEKQLLRMGRAFVVGVVVLTYIVSLTEPRSVFKLGTWCFSGFAGLFPLTIAAIYWRRATKWGAIASILAGGVAWLWMFHDSGYGSQEDYHFMGWMPVAPIVAVATMALIGVSMMSRPPTNRTLEKFFALGVK
ncbi:MAG: sodium:solute symporter family protein [Planctomycetota bacterium]